MEQIYTIPINEAFEAARDDHSCGCPVCSLYRMLEENELDLILGASMMEPDVRIQTNKQGFCKTHYDMMFVRKNRLGMALTLESHLAEIRKDIDSGGISGALGKPGEKQISRIDKLDDSCYVCSRIEYNFSRLLSNIVYLWKNDADFRVKYACQPYFCLPHYKMLLEVGRDELDKKQFSVYKKQTAEIVEEYFDELSEDVSWFCKKFDYRYADEPWNNSKDAVERAIKFLCSDLHRPPEKKK